jgi:Cu-processing system permease protein
MFVAFVGTISAVVISFDCILKERLQHSIEFLVCRPIKKSYVIIGKFLGLASALAIPAIAIIICSIVAVWYAIGTLPSFKMAFGFLALTIILIAIFITIEFVFSNLAKSLGTAIIFGIATWFLFTTFWAIIPLSVAYIAKVPLESVEYNLLRSRIDLLSPIGSYDLALGILANGGEGIVPAVHYSLPFISLILWLILPLWCSIQIFKRTEY